MTDSRLHIITIFILIILLTSCSNASVPSNAEEQSTNNNATCPSIVQSAVVAANQNCASVGRNQVCYGNVALEAKTINNASLNLPGDIVDLENVERLELSPMDVSQARWGVVMMKLQANISGTTPGQAVTFLMFGDVELENRDANNSDLQSFYFRTGIGDAQCDESPESGILVQTPEGVANISLSLNNVDIVLGSTAYLQAQPEAQMRVNVIEGRAEVTAQGVTQLVEAGNQTQIELDEEGLAVSEPSIPVPYESTELDILPIDMLERGIEVASTVFSTSFLEDAENWRIFQDGSDFEYFPADDESNGYVCARDLGQGIYWYFETPEQWAGDRSDLYNGELRYRMRQRDNAGTVSGLPDIMLVSDEMILHYEFGDKPLLTWTSFSAPLNENGGWTLNDEVATADNFQTVLSNLTSIRIRGEYVNGADSACMDAVQLVKGT